MNRAVLHVFAKEERLCFRVRLKPQARCNEIRGLEGGLLQIGVQAPPVEQKANQELIRFLAQVLGLPSRWVHLLGGRRGRLKTVGVEGISEEELRTRITQHLVEQRLL